MRVEAKNIPPDELDAVAAAGHTVIFSPDDEPQGELPDNREITSLKEFCSSNSNGISWVGKTGYTRLGTPEHLDARRGNRD